MGTRTIGAYVFVLRRRAASLPIRGGPLLFFDPLFGRGSCRLRLLFVASLPRRLAIGGRARPLGRGVVTRLPKTRLLERSSQCLTVVLLALAFELDGVHLGKDGDWSKHVAWLIDELHDGAPQTSQVGAQRVSRRSHRTGVGVLRASNQG